MTLQNIYTAVFRLSNIIGNLVRVLPVTIAGHITARQTKLAFVLICQCNHFFPLRYSMLPNSHSVCTSGCLFIECVYNKNSTSFPLSLGLGNFPGSITDLLDAWTFLKILIKSLSLYDST